jgi:hypothetical protein
MSICISGLFADAVMLELAWRNILQYAVISAFGEALVEVGSHSNVPKKGR